MTKKLTKEEPFEPSGTSTVAWLSFFGVIGLIGTAIFRTDPWIPTYYVSANEYSVNSICDTSGAYQVCLYEQRVETQNCNDAASNSDTAFQKKLKQVPKEWRDFIPKYTKSECNPGLFLDCDYYKTQCIAHFNALISLTRSTPLVKQ